MTLLASFNWQFIWDHLPDFLEGLKATLKVAGIGIAGSLAVGVVLGAARAHRIPIVSWLAAIYVEVIRNTPILVQIFFIFRALPHFPGHPIRLEPFTVARLKTFLNITLPIGGRIALPSSINTYISVVKNTALLTVVGFAEMTNTAYNLESESFKPTEIYLTLGVIYLVVVWSLSALVRLIESRLALPERG